MSVFEDYRAFRTFADGVRTISRFVLSPYSKSFIDAFRRMARTKLVQVPKQACFVRAQKGNDWRPFNVDEVESHEIPTAFGPNRMKPLSDRAYEGRVNPTGIPCLYLSDDKETAIAETRSLVGDCISVGHFILVRDLTLVDFSERSEATFVFFRDPPDDRVDALVWQDINTAFSTPVTRDGQVAEYAPTQILAECLKEDHADGILYRSRLGPGRNLALFDLDAAELCMSELQEVTVVRYEFELQDGPFEVRSNSGQDG